MTCAASRRTLVLNADWNPISSWPLSLIPATDAVKAVFRERADVVAEWPEVFRSPSTTIQVPKVIALRDYASLHGTTPKFCRRSILLRDRFKCQYCGERFASEDLTFDHVLPRSKGGKTVWENILTCCVECNAKKRDQMPRYSGRKGAGALRPLKVPRQPTTAELLRAGLEFLEPEIRETWGDFLYWNTPLQT